MIAANADLFFGVSAADVARMYRPGVSLSIDARSLVIFDFRAAKPERALVLSLKDYSALGSSMTAVHAKVRAGRKRFAARDITRQILEFVRRKICEVIVTLSLASYPIRSTKLVQNVLALNGRRESIHPDVSISHGEDKLSIRACQGAAGAAPHP